MSALFNLVGTNSLDGDHAMLQRWYADHVHLLMRFAGLHHAQLMQRSDVVPGLAAPALAAPSPATHPATHTSAPQYLCLYEFASAQAFAEFEASPERANAPKLGRPDWMATGIHIVLRQQYTRQVVQRNLQAPHSGTPRLLQLHSFSLPAVASSAEQLDAERWLQGGMHQALLEPHAQQLSLLHRKPATPALPTATAPAAAAPTGSEYLALLSHSAKPRQGHALDLIASAQTDHYGLPACTAQTHWQAAYQPLAAWRR